MACHGDLSLINFSPVSFWNRMFILKTVSVSPRPGSVLPRPVECFYRDHGVFLHETSGVFLVETWSVPYHGVFYRTSGSVIVETMECSYRDQGDAFYHQPEDDRHPGGQRSRAALAGESAQV
ncbi:unnamed protein product [Arctogadus glacialis]